ncbi:MAG TPA: YfhO family protein, partial [Candidatus Obscuribacterales bacterium]
GVLSAVCVATMHPEPCFFAITFSALLFLTMAVVEPGASLRPAQQRFLHALKVLSLSAIVAICLSAPVLLPFFEFFANASFYKAVHANTLAVNNSLHAPYSILDYLRGLIIGQADDALFIGTLAAVFLLLGVVYGRGRVLAITFVWLMAILLSMPVGWLADLLALKPLSYLAPRYCLPNVVLFGALVAAAGFQWILDETRESSRQKRFVFLCSTTLVLGAVAFFTWQKLGGNVLAPIGIQGLISEIWRNKQLLTIVAVAASGFALVLIRDKLGRFRSVIVAIALICLNFLSQATICKNVLPVCPRFDPATPQPIKFLQEHPGRIAATGDHFLLPNMNLLYGLDDCRAYNPLNLKRYASFFDRHGMTLGSAFTLTLPNRLDHLIDLASVRHIVTREAITSVDDNESLPGCYSLAPASEGRIALGLRLKRARLYYDAINSQINGSLQWRIHDYASNRYALQYFVLDSSGKELWSSQRKLISSAGAAAHLVEQSVALPVPLSVDRGSTIDICFSVYDSWTSTTVKPDGLTLSLTGPHVRLTSLQTVDTANSSPYRSRSPSTGNSTGRHFLLVKEIPANCRIYDNQTALPSAYIASRGVFVNSPEESLKKVDHLSFDPRTEVILESTNPVPTNRGTNPVEASGNVRVERPNPNAVVVHTASESDGFLVLTDAYYPGWRAKVDGQEVEILKANHLFRAVRLPAGTHRVEFDYRPGSFLLGLGLAAIGAAIVLLVLIRRWLSK